VAARYRISRLIDSRNCYELTQRGFVISRTDKLERIRSIEEISSCDKGGMIFSPRVGLHENVAVLDYENEYANLILGHNLSYERRHNVLYRYDWSHSNECSGIMARSGKV
jgi:DNA polymerase elongation subunit (family B)